MNKTIQINPDLFTLSSSGTRKKKNEPKELKIKVPKENKNTLAKRNTLLKFIRRHQEKNTKKSIHDAKKDSIVQSDPIPSDFDDSLKYLMDMTENYEKEANTTKPTKVNYTLKNQHEPENVSMIFPETEKLIPTTLPTFHKDLPHMHLAAPKYGCLKHGKLPTYRQFHGPQTQRNLPRQIGSGNVKTLGNDDSFSENRIIQKKVKEGRKMSYPSQKKILRRTFKVGKSNKHRKVSVLVGNKTIRHQISNKNQTLKETPLIEVRRYLVKHGLIKIGSIAPPDVLRKMFESASLLCGSVTNHNSEILMFNYMNSDKKTW